MIQLSHSWISQPDHPVTSSPEVRWLNSFPGLRKQLAKCLLCLTSSSLKCLHGSSLMLQWLKLHDANAGVWSLVRELGPRVKSESESHSVVSGSLWPHGLHSQRNSPGQNTGMGSLSLFQGIFPTPGLNPGLLHCRQILHHLSHQGSPKQNTSFLYCLFSGMYIYFHSEGTTYTGYFWDMEKRELP